MTMESAVPPRRSRLAVCPWHNVCALPSACYGGVFCRDLGKGSAWQAGRRGGVSSRGRGILWARPGTGRDQLRPLLEHATRVELCLFDEATVQSERASRCASRRATSGTATCRASGRASATATAWTGHSAGGGHALQPEQAADRSLCAALTGEVDWDAPVFGYRLGSERGPDARTSTTPRAGVPKGVVVDDAFDWGDDRPPQHAAARHGHLRGCTSRGSPCAIPTCPRSCAAPTPGWPRRRSIDHLQALGVTAVELLPVHDFVDDSHLVEKGLRTTGATTRSASSRPRRATPAAATPAGR